MKIVSVYSPPHLQVHNRHNCGGIAPCTQNKQQIAYKGFMICIPCVLTELNSSFMTPTNAPFICSVIKKNGLNFLLLYFLNYTRYVNDLHKI